MTDKMQLFVIEYLKDFNATQAAIRAGYSKRTASVVGHENLRKPNIREEIEKAKNQIINDKQKIIFDNIIFWQQVRDDVKSTKTDRLKASELLGKYVAMFTEKIDLSASITLVTDADDEQL